MILYPTIEEALALYDAVTEQFGGAKGIRDKGLLESALYRPQCGYYSDLFEMAAALMESLIINHPFVDGNKRMAFFLADVFLRINGYKIQVDADSGYEFVIDVIANSENRFERIRNWLKQSVYKTT